MIAENKKACSCDKQQFAICTPVAMTREGAKLLNLNREWVGQYVCYNCGGISETKPEEYDHITGETVIRRLVELGMAYSPTS